MLTYPKTRYLCSEGTKTQKDPSKKTIATSAWATASNHVITCTSWISNETFWTCLYKAEIWYIGVIRCVELKSEVIFWFKLRGRSYLTAKFCIKHQLQMLSKLHLVNLKHGQQVHWSAHIQRHGNLSVISGKRAIEKGRAIRAIMSLGTSTTPKQFANHTQST